MPGNGRLDKTARVLKNYMNYTVITQSADAHIHQAEYTITLNMGNSIFWNTTNEEDSLFKRNCFNKLPQQYFFR